MNNAEAWRKWEVVTFECTQEREKADGTGIYSGTMEKLSRPRRGGRAEKKEWGVKKKGELWFWGRVSRITGGLELRKTRERKCKAEGNFILRQEAGRGTCFVGGASGN